MEAAWKAMGVGEGQEHVASKFGEYELCPFLTYFLNIYPWTRISPSVLLVGKTGRLQVGVKWVNGGCTKSKQRKDPRSRHHVPGAGQSTKHSVPSVPCLL